MRYIQRSWFGLEATTDGLLETLLSQLQGEPAKEPNARSREGFAQTAEKLITSRQDTR